MTRTAILLAAIVIIWPTLVEAKCTHPRIPWAYGRTVHSTWRVTDGTPCKMTNKNPQNIQKMEIELKPSHGIAGKDGPFGVAYKVNDGFKGWDSFVIGVTSNANYRKGAGWVARIIVRVVSR